MAENPLQHDIDDWAATLLSTLSPAERRKLARQIGTELRRINAKRIRANTAPDGSAWPTRKPQKRGKNAPKVKAKMYTGMSKAKYLKIKTTPEGVVIGFFGRVARIARVAQFGEYDKPSPNAAPVQYAERPLLGFTEQDKQAILNLLAEHFSQ